MPKYLFTVYINDTSVKNFRLVYHTNAIEKDGSWVKFTDSFKDDHCVDISDIKITVNLPNE